MASDSPLSRLIAALGTTVLGQPHVIADLVTAFLARGHVLLEGVPGVAKTLDRAQHGRARWGCSSPASSSPRT